jgi:hypothetical protein
MAMASLRWGWTLGLAVALGGCNVVASGSASTGPGSVPENPDPPTDALELPGRPGLEGCTAGLAGSELDAQLQIARDFRESCHEMVVCGGLNASFSLALIRVLVNAAAGGATHPTGFTYAGDGLWRVAETMTVRLHLPQDTTWGRAGDPITFDVFDIESYFTGVTIVASASVDLSGETRTSLSIQFEGVGPGAELLGLGPEPSTPLQLDAEQIADALGRIEIRNDILVDDPRGDTRVLYTLRGAPTPISELARDGAQGMELVGVTAINEVTGQTIVITDWGMEYRAGVARTLDGTIDFQVVGGAVEYSSRFVYPHRGYPDVTLGCLAE